MLVSQFTYLNEDPCHHDAIEKLNAETFGPGRHARAAARVREQGPHDKALSFVCLDGVELIGSVRMTSIAIGEVNAYLLGPLAVDRSFKRKGIGRELLKHAIHAAKATNTAGVLLVGDEAYYAPSGFSRAGNDVQLPGPVDRDRLLFLPFIEIKPMELTGKVRFCTV
jgi:predicted N-acetyltransferase YhbS